MNGRRTRRLGAARSGVLLVAALGCTQQPPASRSGSSLEAGVVARVGGERISAELVGLVAAAQGESPKAALERLISDVRWARAARERLPSSTVAVVERAAAGRAILETLREQARQAGPASPEEKTDVLRERWVDLDRPAAVRTVHAAVLVKKPEDDAPARALAERVAAAVSGAVSAADFAARARSVPAAPLELRVEPLPPITADGRSFQVQGNAFRTSASHFDADFSRAANALRSPGDLSPVVKSVFGYHVIRLEQAFPALELTPAERDRRVLEEVVTQRAATLRKALVERLRAAAVVTRDRASDELTARTVGRP